MKKQNPWPDFLFALAVRFVCGVFMGGLACIVLTGRGMLWAFSRNHTHAPLLWLVLCAVAGGLIAVFTVPRWQKPWYKRDLDELSILRGLHTQPPERIKLGSTVVKRSMAIRTVDADGKEHQYSSMDQVPPEIRPQLEALEKEAAQQKGTEISITENSPQGNTLTSKTIRNISVYKIVDESGVERTYHSLDEMPPEIRAAIEEAEKKNT
ncbi:MAG TPA: hypothetical protein VKV04_25620 [Verrucomicrobiae bacterium]|nr:hypothetical protein [Verrucomicrobiae bacterium]